MPTSLVQQLIIDLVETRLGPVEWQLDLWDSCHYTNQQGGYLEVYPDGHVRAAVKEGSSWLRVSLMEALNKWKP